MSVVITTGLYTLVDNTVLTSQWNEELVLPKIGMKNCMPNITACSVNNYCYSSS